MRKVKNILLFILTLLPMVTFGQSRNVHERVYISTDKGSYVSGEGIGCAVYCFQLEGGNLSLSGLSSVAYLELVSSQGVVLQEKVALVEGRGGVVLRLSPDIPTGNYKLVVYTKQNRNEEGFIPYSKDISIYNTLTNAKVEGNVEVVEGALAASGDNTPPQTDLISVEIPQSHGTESLPVKIVSHTEESLSLNVSIYRKDALQQLPVATFGDFVAQAKSSRPGTLTSSFIPDFEGETVQFKSDAEGKNMILSFPGAGSNVYISGVESGGLVSFYAGSIYGEKYAMLQIMPGYEERSHKTEAISPFIGKFDFSYPTLYLSEELNGDLVSRGVSMQVNRRFGADTLTIPLPERGDPFLEEPDKSYLLDDYTRFHTMHEVITEYVSNVRIRTLDGKKNFSVLFKDALGNEMFSRFATLVLLDGMPIFNHEDILNYDPMLVKRIRIYAHSYRISDITYEGVICFDTYRGDIPSFPMDSTAMMLSFKGALYPEYISGDYLSGQSAIPDYRHTLYWHPLVTIGGGDAFEFDCILPKTPGLFDVVIEGVTESGKAVYYKDSIELR